MESVWILGIICVLAGVAGYSWHLSQWQRFLKTVSGKKTQEERDEYLFHRHRYCRRTVMSGILVMLGLFLPLSVWLVSWSLQWSVFLIYGILLLLFGLVILAIYDAIASSGYAARQRDEEMIKVVREVYSRKKMEKKE